MAGMGRAGKIKPADVFKSCQKKEKHYEKNIS
jgi:hypothetical protein